MRLPAVVVPCLIVLFALLAIPLKALFNYPAAQASFAEDSSIDGRNVNEIEMIVQGVKCRGTANYFISRYENEPGIMDITAYAADHKVVIKFDRTKIDTDKIKAIGEAPVEGGDGQLYEFFKVERITAK